MQRIPSSRSVVVWVVLGCWLALIGGSETQAQALYTDAEMLNVAWKATPEAIEGLLPAPLEPYKEPLVVAFIADFPKTNFGVTYTMAAISIVCEYDGELGTYCVGMPEDDDIPVFLGRELQGYPKKMAKVSLKRDGDKIDGWVERRGIKFFEIHATVTEKPESAEYEEITREVFKDETKMDAVAFNIWSFSPPGGGPEYTPKLVRQVTRFRPYNIEYCNADVVTRESPYDSPWHKLKPVTVLGSTYTKGNNTMMGAKVVADVEPKTYLKFSRMKYDW